MGFRMRKSIKIMPGVRLNLGKKSAGISFGTKGLRYSINSSGRRTATVSIPGTGISYSKSSSRKRNSYQKRQSTIAKQRAKEYQKQLEIEKAGQCVDEYLDKINSIKSVHKVCDEYIDWKAISTMNPPFNPEETGPKEKEALTKLISYKPGFLARIFKFLDLSKREKLKSAVTAAKEADTEDYNNWKSLHKTSLSILNGNIDVMLAVIEELKPLDDLLNLGSGFEIFIQDPNLAEIEFEVMSEQVIPKQVLSLTSTGRLSKRKMPKSKKFDLTQDYICSCILRIARDMFAILPLKKVLIHANDTFINTQTGVEEKATIVSVKIEREILDKLNFDLLDPSDAMNNFTCNMKFRKTLGFSPVERVEL
ncbi:conserved hypothetical protein [Clostridiaceae bacterium BL-3]|nr:conserved hypothetical protein [Clostridiaceae bacterium BL-3]